MASADEEVVRRIYERWNTNSRDFALDLFDPEVDMHQTSAILDSAGTFHGHEGLLASAGELLGAFSNILFQPQEWMPAGDWLIVRLRIVGIGRGSGAKTDVEVTHAWRLQHGVVTDFHVYITPDEARRKLGLGE